MENVLARSKRGQAHFEPTHGQGMVTEKNAADASICASSIRDATSVIDPGFGGAALALAWNSRIRAIENVIGWPAMAGKRAPLPCPEAPWQLKQAGTSCTPPLSASRFPA